METRVDEIAEDIYRISTFGLFETGFTFNQFLIHDNALLDRPA